MSAVKNAVVDLVVSRDRGRCVACGRPLFGERGWGWHIHHRSARRMGSSKRPHVNLAGNLVTLHRACHEGVESRREDAEARGLLVREGVRLPAEVPVWHAVYESWVLLSDDGKVTYIEGGER